MISFTFMEKTKAEQWLPLLFDMLYENMSEIDPQETDREVFKAEWLEELTPAVMKPQRQIILIEDDGALIGYFQYYVNEKTFMMEEIQFKKEYRGSGLFRRLYRFLRGVIPVETPFVEAFALKNNCHSRAILKHLGLEPVGESANGRCLHFRGDCRAMFDLIAGTEAE